MVTTIQMMLCNLVILELSHLYIHGIWHVCMISYMQPCNQSHAVQLVNFMNSCMQYLLQIHALLDAYLLLNYWHCKDLIPNKQLLIVGHAHLYGNACGLPTVYQVESWQMFGVAKHEHIYTTACLSNMHDTVMSHAEAIIFFYISSPIVCILCYSCT